MLKPKKPRDRKVHCKHHLQGECRRGEKCNFYHKGENEEVGDCPDYLEGKCAFGEECMKGHHDESKLRTPPQELHSKHFDADAVLDSSVEHLDEIEARSGPSAKRRLSMHSSEDAVSEGGDSLDSLSLQDFQGSASEEENKEEGAASGEEKDFTTRDIVVTLMKRSAEIEKQLERSAAELSNSKWLPPWEK